MGPDDAEDALKAIGTENPFRDLDSPYYESEELHLLRGHAFGTPVRYFAVTVCGYCVDFAIYAALVAAGVSVYPANLAAFCVGTVANVILIRTFVFPDSRFRLDTDVLLTAILNGAMLAVGMGILWLLVEWALLNPYLAKLLSNGTTFVVNYMTRSLFFRKK